MTDIQFAYTIRNTIKNLTPPADTTNIAIVNISHGQIQLASSPGGTTNQWVNAIVEVTSGPSAGSRAIIVANNGNVISYTTPFFGGFCPSAGDTVVLKGGPMSDARVFIERPDTINKAVDDGVTTFISIAPESGQIIPKSFSGNDTYNHASGRFSYSFRVEGEIVDDDDVDADTDELKETTFLIYELAHQIAHALIKIVNTPENNISSFETIRYVYGFMSRDNSPRTKAVIFGFDVVF